MDLRVKFPAFSTSSKAPIENWIFFYERHFGQLGERGLFNSLWYNLEGDAQHWFGMECASGKFNAASWDEVKNAVIKRFATQDKEYLVQAIERKLQQGESMSDYFNAKMTMFTRASHLTEKERMGFLTAGLPESWKYEVQKLELNCRDTTDWLKAASIVFQERTRIAALNRQQARPSAPGPRFQQHPQLRQFAPTQRQFASNAPFQAPRMSGSTHQRPTGRPLQPPNPCRNCQAAQKPNQYHWPSECPIRASRQTANNATEQAVALNSVSGPSFDF